MFDDLIPETDNVQNKIIDKDTFIKILKENISNKQKMIDRLLNDNNKLLRENKYLKNL
jgi:hypothetical protein